MAAKDVELKFDLNANYSYSRAIYDLRGALAAGSTKEVEGHAVLEKPTGDEKAPLRWIYVELKGSKDEPAPKVAIRSDNAYLLGFCNSQGKWFQFTIDGKDGRPTKTVVLPKKLNATLLGFTGDYHSLLGKQDLEVTMPKLELGKFATKKAAAVLWNHGTTKADPLKLLKEALAKLVVTLCEAARLIPVYNVVARGWDKGHASYVTARDIEYIGKWGQISLALLGWSSDPKKDWFKDVAKSTGIRNAEEALLVVQLLLNNPPTMSLWAWLKYLWSFLVAANKKPQQVAPADKSSDQKPHPPADK